MKSHVVALFISAIFILLHGNDVYSFLGPFDGDTFQGRIAYSSDGNFNDEDDWAANALHLAILEAFGVQGKVVHFDFNSILPETNIAWEQENRISVLEGATRFGFDDFIFYDTQN